MFVSSLSEPIRWDAVHGATAETRPDGCLVLRDDPSVDWHLLRWTDSRLDGVRVKLTMVAEPAPGGDTNLYVHHWGNKDICSITREGRVALDEGAEEIEVECQPDGFLRVTVVFANNHPTLSIGTGKPHGRYQGSGKPQFAFKSIDVELLPKNPLRRMLVDRLWRGYDPLRDVPGNIFAQDLQGWNSQHPYLAGAIRERRPSIIVEIGVWKGGSTIHMANVLKELGMKGVVIGVDTWLGSSEHFYARSRAEQQFFNGRPGLYYTFLSNVKRMEVGDFVLPLPLDSLNAADLLKRLKIRPEVIHLDGGHDYDSVMSDLRAWWPALAPGGLFIGDDYFTDGVWETVRRAYDDFFGALSLSPVENTNGKCRITKPR